MRIHRVLGLVLAVVCAVVAPTRGVRAQTSIDVIRGIVTGPDDKPIADAGVTATAMSNSTTRQARTDKNGSYTIPFPDGGGDYYITISAIGFIAKRFEVKQLADEDVLIGNAKLGKVPTTLDAVRVTARRQAPNRNDQGVDIGGNERAINLAAVSLDQLGDLAAMAATLPGVTYIPGVDGAGSGFSILGLDPSLNSTLVDGMMSSASNLPADAQISGSLATAPYDVSRGGFAGGQLSIRTSPGGNFIRRTSSFAGISPQLELTTPAGRALGQQATNGSIGGSASGPIKFNKIFFNSSYQFIRNSNPLQTLLNTDPLGLQTAGISSDSAARLLGILQQAGIPATLSSIPDTKVLDQVLLQGRLDMTPPSATSGQQYAVSGNGLFNTVSPNTASTTTVPGYSGERKNWNYQLGTRLSNYFSPFAFPLLSETNFGIIGSGASTDPYIDLPAGRVLVSSTFADSTPGATKYLSFGGSPSRSSNSSMTEDVTNALRWFSLDSKHSFRFTTELRRDAMDQHSLSNGLGTYTYQSLGDLAAGDPSQFTRTLTTQTLGASQLAGAASLGDTWHPTPDFQLQYGARIDGNRFESNPDYNPEVDQLFHLRTDQVPDHVYVSPRVGFAWTLGTAPQIASFAGAARTPRSIIRGGVGYFQNVGASSLITSEINYPGLPSSVQQLSCVGSAVPIPDWTAYGDNTSLVPGTCADGTGATVLASTVPQVIVFDPSYQQTRRLNSNVQWNGRLLDNLFTSTVDLTYSRVDHLPEQVDLNFDPSVQFTLPDEDNRPVYVPSTSIVPVSGAIAPGAGRVTTLFSRVAEVRSDLVTDTKQLTISIAPVTNSTTFKWNASYVYDDQHDLQSGFSANTAGDPLNKAWGPSAGIAPQSITYSLSYTISAVTLNWFGSFRKGSLFTPSVSGDINGDGVSGNDRAFVFDPAHTADPTVATEMQSLLSNGSVTARHCLDKQLGEIAARNSCAGPWTAGGGTLTLYLNAMKLRLPQRATVSIGVGNPLGGADLLLHGENKLHGWGQSQFLDGELLQVSGYNPSTQSFKYTVNPRFGSTASALNTAITPTTLNLRVAVDVGPSRERQTLTQLLDRGRAMPGLKASAATIKAQFSQSGITNPMAQILREADSLKLTTDQGDSVAALNRRYTTRADSLWTPIAETLALLPDKYDQGDAYRVYRSGREQTFDLLIAIAPLLQRILTSEQKRMLPTLIASYMDVASLEYMRSSTVGGGLIGR